MQSLSLLILFIAPITSSSQRQYPTLSYQDHHRHHHHHYHHHHHRHHHQDIYDRRHPTLSIEIRVSSSLHKKLAALDGILWLQRKFSLSPSLSTINYGQDTYNLDNRRHHLSCPTNVKRIVHQGRVPIIKMEF